MNNNSSTGTGTATTEVSNLNWYPCTYTGSAVLAGFEGSTNPIAGEYVEQEGVFLFKPSGSGKIFEVSDEDIKRVPTAVAAG